MAYSAKLDAFSLVDRHVAVGQFSMESSDIPTFFLKAAADFRLDATGAYQFQFVSNDLPAPDLLGMFFDSPKSIIDGKLDLQGSAIGEFQSDKSPAQAVVKIDVASPQLRVGGVDLGLLEHSVELTEKQVTITPRSGVRVKEPDRFVIQQLVAAYDVSPDRFRIDQLDAKLFGGSVSASAEFSRDGRGQHIIDAKWSDIQPKFSIRVFGGDRNILLSGKTAGTVKWMAPADKLDSPHFHRGSAIVTIDPLRLGQRVLGGMTAEIQIEQGSLQASAEGKLLGRARGNEDCRADSNRRPLEPDSPTIVGRNPTKQGVAGPFNQCDFRKDDAFRR